LKDFSVKYEMKGVPEDDEHDGAQFVLQDGYDVQRKEQALC